MGAVVCTLTTTGRNVHFTLQKQLLYVQWCSTVTKNTSSMREITFFDAINGRWTAAAADGIRPAPSNRSCTRIASLVARFERAAAACCATLAAAVVAAESAKATAPCGLRRDPDWPAPRRNRTSRPPAAAMARQHVSDLHSSGSVNRVKNDDW